MRRVAVVSDVHGNPWAMRAVLGEIRTADVDLVVNCGDLVAGPWPTEVLEELLGCGIPVLSVRGNGDRMVCDAYDGRWDDVIAPARAVLGWAAGRLTVEHRRLIGELPLLLQLEVEGMGEVVFFHATPEAEVDDDVDAQCEGAQPDVDEPAFDDVGGRRRVRGPVESLHPLVLRETEGVALDLDPLCRCGLARTRQTHGQEQRRSRHRHLPP